jgi:hypothetical protein
VISYKSIDIDARENFDVYFLENTIFAKTRRGPEQISSHKQNEYLSDILESLCNLYSFFYSKRGKWRILLREFLVKK